VSALAADDFDVIVVTHRSAAALPACLTALGALRLRVLAVDNASDDGTRALLAREDIATLALAANTGFAAAANAGARATRAPLLCFLNPDCEAGADVFAAAHAALSRRDDACAVPRLREQGRVIAGRQPGYSAVKLLWDVLASNYGEGALCRWLARRPGFDDASWSWPHGACLFVPRVLFDALGGFDDRFFLYMEDVDLGRRLAARGACILHLDAEVRHGGHAGAGVAHRRQLGLLNRGRARYAELHHGRWLAHLLSGLALPSMALRAAFGIGA
jgi:hypothetical protein